MSTDQPKIRRKKILAALLAFRKKLRVACGRFNTAKSWYSFLKKNLNPLLARYQDDLPAGAVTRIKEATSLIDDTSSGITKTCETLDGEIGKIVAAYSPTAPFGHWLTLGLMVAALAIGVAVIYLIRASVTLTVKNQGCAPLVVTGSVPINLPGVSLPGTIPTGGSATIKLPPLSAVVTANNQGSITLKTMGITVDFNLQPGVVITFDGQNLLGKRTEINLASQPEHLAVVACQPNY